MTITPDWIIAIVGLITIVGMIIGFFWKFSSSINKSFGQLTVSINQNTAVTENILAQQKAQWTKIDDHSEKIQSHDTQLTKLETWKEYHEDGHV